MVLPACKSQGSCQRRVKQDSTSLCFLSIFYPKEKMNGKRLHELDQDIIEAITGIRALDNLNNNEGHEKLVHL